MGQLLPNMSRSPRPEPNEVRNSDEKLELYEHKELHDDRTIRLIKLRPAGSKTNDVECELITADLEKFAEGYGNTALPNGDLENGTISHQPDSYEALSWSWGSEDWDHEVRIHHTDGVMYYFPLPETLVNALKAMRSAKRVRYLWVDTICIDQANANEKNRQGRLGLIPSMNLPDSNDSAHDVSNLRPCFQRLCVDRRK
jgi:hypothetical protein